MLGLPAVIAEVAAVPNDFMEHVNYLGANGFRVLAVASGEGGKLVCQGLIALADPPRDDAQESVEKYGG